MSIMQRQHLNKIDRQKIIAKMKLMTAVKYMHEKKVSWGQQQEWELN
jgi:hypothetical protein